jgi:hypothetical protein
VFSNWGNGCEAHERAVASAARINRAREWVARFRVLRERRADGDADVEAPACATQVAVSPPAHVPIHLILGIEPLALQPSFAQAKRHAGVVGPLAGLQVKRAAPTMSESGLNVPGEILCGGSEREQDSMFGTRRSNTPCESESRLGSGGCGKQ